MSIHQYQIIEVRLKTRELYWRVDFVRDFSSLILSGFEVDDVGGPY